MQKPLTSKAIAKFHIGLSKATRYEPAIAQRLTAYWCGNKFERFLSATVNGYKKRYHPNDPKLFERAQLLINSARHAA